MSGYQAFETTHSPATRDSSSHNRMIEEQVDLKRPPVFVLAAGFLGAFALAWLVVVAVFFSFNKSPAAVVATVSTQKETGPFVSTVKITTSGPALKVKHSESLNPTGGDFMLFIWFKADAPVGGEDRSVILGKYEAQDGVPDGYGIALLGGTEGVRPQVYWRNKGTRGRWYVFASAHVEPQKWYLLAVTFRSQRYLGVHIAPMSPSGNPEVLGGYDLEGSIIPSNVADLVIGALGTSTFRGEIGSFGVLRNIDIAQDASKIMKRMAREPALGADVVEPSQIALWASPLVDRGPHNLPIIDLMRRSRRETAPPQ